MDEQTRAIDGSHDEDWYTCAAGTLLNGAYYQYFHAEGLAKDLRAAGIPCRVHRLDTGHGLPLYTVKRVD